MYPLLLVFTLIFIIKMMQKNKNEKLKNGCKLLLIFEKKYDLIIVRGDNK